MGNCLHREKGTSYKYSKEDLNLYLQYMEKRLAQREKQEVEQLRRQEKVKELLLEAEKAHPSQRQDSANQSRQLDYIEEQENESSYIEVEQQKISDSGIIQALLQQQNLENGNSQEVQQELDMRNSNSIDEQLLVTKRGLRDENEMDEDILLYFNTNVKQYSSVQASQIGL